MEPLKVVIIGAGNVGYHLGKALSALPEINILQVFSRKPEKATSLASALGTNDTADLNSLDQRADLYVIAVSDDAIESVANTMHSQGFEDKLVVHTSGSTPSSVLSPFFNRYGTFYPLQTFSLNRNVPFEEIPIVVNASQEADCGLLERIAQKISQSVYRMDDDQRLVLHIAAVFVCNFVNHLFTLGDQVLRKASIPFDILKPLIKETVSKALENNPEWVQTGPSRRGDSKTINRHLAFLETDPVKHSVYEVLSTSIRSLYQDKKS